MFKKIFFLLFLISFSITTKAQYTEVINSNHPGFSKSPYSVGIGVYQFETSIFQKQHKSNTIFDNPISTGLNLDFRTSFFLENLEINLNTSVHRDKYTFKNVFISDIENKIGLGNLTVGAKYLVFAPKYIDKSKEIRSWKKRHSFDWNRCIPHAGVYAGFNFGSVLEGPYNKGNTAKIGILLQNEFDLRYNFITNVYYDNIGSDHSELSYILTSTYLFSQQWSGFLEHQAKFNQFENTFNAGGGLTYLYSEDLQLNSSVRATFQESGLGYHANLGLSYRIDRHVDKFTELDEFGNPIDGGSGKKKYGFFGRMYQSVKRLFIRSEDVKIDDIDEDGKPTTTTVKIPNKERKRSKSVLKKIVKKDKKNKNKKAKKDNKALKKAKRKETKAKNKIEKRKRKIEDEKIEELTEKLEEKEELLKIYLKEKEENSEGESNIPQENSDDTKTEKDEEENTEETLDDDQLEEGNDDGNTEEKLDQKNPKEEKEKDTNENTPTNAPESEKDNTEDEDNNEENTEIEIPDNDPNEIEGDTESEENTDNESIDFKIEKIKKEIELHKKVIEEEKKTQKERRLKVEEENKKSEKADEEDDEEDTTENEDKVEKSNDASNDNKENKLEKKKKEKSKRISSISGLHIDLEKKEKYVLSFKDINSDNTKFVSFDFRGPKTNDFEGISETILNGFKKAVADETIKFKTNGELIGLKYIKQNGIRVVQFVKYSLNSRAMSRTLSKDEIEKLFKK